MDSAGNFIVSTPSVETMSQEEVERINAFKLPDVAIPSGAPPKVNQFAKTAIAEGYRWAQTVPGLLHNYRTPEELQKLYKENAPKSLMLVFADCGEKEAIYMVKFMLWLYLFEDGFDDPTFFRSPEKSMTLMLELNVMFTWSFPEDKQFYKNFVNFLDEGSVVDRAQALQHLQVKLDEARLRPGTVKRTISDTLSPESHPLCKALRDIWTPLFETMPADFLRRFRLALQNHILASFGEVRVRKCNILSLDEYVASRRDTISTHPILVLAEFVYKAHISDEIYHSPEMQRCIIALADFTAYMNDLYSFKREALIGEMHNLVFLLSKEHDCPYAEAGEKVGKIILDRIAEMEKAISDLEKVTPPEFQHAISWYIVTARNVVLISNHFFNSSERYSQSVSNSSTSL